MSVGPSTLVKHQRRPSRCKTVLGHSVSTINSKRITIHQSELFQEHVLQITLDRPDRLSFRDEKETTG